MLSFCHSVGELLSHLLLGQCIYQCDVIMGTFDGAEVAEFVGLFILHKLSSIMDITDFALYRDDGICAIKGTERTVNKVRKKLEKMLSEIGFKVDIPPTGQ